MHDMELPDWIVQLRKRYETDPVKWMSIGGAVVVILLIGAFANYIIGQHKKDATETLSQSLQALDAGEYATAATGFQKIETAYNFSGLGDEAKMLSAASLFGLGDYDKSEEEYRKILQSNPKDYSAPEAQLGIGACREMMGDTVGALAAYKTGRDKYGDSFLAKTFDVRIARLARLMGDTLTLHKIYDRLESDTEGLWKEIARGNRRMISLKSEPTDRTDTSHGAGQSGSRFIR